MTTYRKYNWPELFALFEQSGLSQTEFCKQHTVNAKYFSQKRLLSLGKKTARFDKVETSSAQPITSNFTIQIGRCQIQCPHGMPLSDFANLIDHLA